jgi:hypothetical protein
MPEEDERAEEFGFDRRLNLDFNGRLDNPFFIQMAIIREIMNDRAFE